MSHLQTSIKPKVRLNGYCVPTSCRLLLM